jgi:hypothetical protein
MPRVFIICVDAVSGRYVPKPVQESDVKNLTSELPYSRYADCNKVCTERNKEAKKQPPPDAIAVARRLMKEILYDNGMVNRWHPEEYPLDHVERIARVAGPFFKKYRGLYTDPHINHICCGEDTEVEAAYSKYEGWRELTDALNNFFNGE